jgi:hypothetical protein
MNHPPLEHKNAESKSEFRIHLKASNFYDQLQERRQQQQRRQQLGYGDDRGRDQNAITFQDVNPHKHASVRPLISTIRIQERVAGVFDECSPVNGMLDALHTAFAHELGFALDPTHVWICITQAVSARIQSDPSNFRKILGIKHDDKKTLSIFDGTLDINGSTEQETEKWAKVFLQFEQHIADSMQSNWAQLCCTELSTSTRVSTLVQHATLMNSVKHYFDYCVMTLCGMAYVDVRGTQSDWTKLAMLVREMRTATFAKLNDKFFHQWLTYLEMVLHHISTTYDGKPTPHFWNSMYKYESYSGMATIDGWSLLLFPYDGAGEQRIQLVDKPQAHQYVKTLDSHVLGNFATGLNVVPFEWKYLDSRFTMKLVAGFQRPDVCQNSHANSANSNPKVVPMIVPSLGWMVLAENHNDVQAVRRATVQPVIAQSREPSQKDVQNSHANSANPRDFQNSHANSANPRDFQNSQDLQIRDANSTNPKDVQPMMTDHPDPTIVNQTADEKSNRDSLPGAALLILPDNTFQLVFCKGDDQKTRKYLQGPKGIVPIRNKQHHVLDLWYNDDCKVDPKCETNTLGFYVIDACDGAVESFYPYEVSGPILVTAKNGADETHGSRSSLSTHDLECLLQLCTSLKQNTSSDGAIRTFQKQMGMFKPSM